MACRVVEKSKRKAPQLSSGQFSQDRHTSVQKLVNVKVLRMLASGFAVAGAMVPITVPTFMKYSTWILDLLREPSFREDLAMQKDPIHRRPSNLFLSAFRGALVLS